ncbi:MAG: DUF1538 family protein, partial [Solobacterium sp.]|nr:DUF1538 family protein [Solobacterium sp.]
MDKLKEALVSVLPVMGIVLLVSFTPLARLETRERIVFVVCSFFLFIGIGLFNLGADLAMSPIGKYVGVGLTTSKRLGILVITCFLMGVMITVAEPD